MPDRQWSNYRKLPTRPSRLKEVRKHFDQAALKRVCEMHESEFAGFYGMSTTKVPQKAPEDEYYFVDNGSNILAVAHLDTVGLPHQRTANFVDTEAGPVIFSRALDDRLGAYIILELLPRLGLKFDWLLTVGEESGKSTAAFFEPPAGKEYNWLIEFDRGGTDVVMYQYEDDAACDAVEAAGAPVGMGSFSDISYLDHLGRTGFNWGVAYREYHYPEAHAFLDETLDMVGKFLHFHDDNAEKVMVYVDEVTLWGLDDEEIDECEVRERAADQGCTYEEAAEQLREERYGYAGWWSSSCSRRDEDERDADLLADLADARWPG